MENKYNILITYAGDGDFKFIVKRIGEISISKQRPVYIYNVDSGVINDLRVLKRLLLNVAIGAKPTGAYKIYDYNDYTAMPKAIIGQRPNLTNVEPISNNEISSILKGGSAAPTEEINNEPEETEDKKVEDVKKEEVKDTKPKTSNKKKTNKKK